MNRRKFILFNSLWSMFPTIARGNSSSFGADLTMAGALDGYRPVAREIAALFTDMEAARVIGRAYLRQCPECGDAESLLADLELADSDTNRDSFRARLEERRSAEFLSGRTVVVNNWILPRIEAELCALTVLLPAGV